jgi:hypothetical protein
MSDFNDLLEAFKNIRLDYSKASRAISLNKDENVLSSNPSSDMVNVFPVILSAALNDLVKLDIEHPEKVENFVGALIDNLTKEAFNELNAVAFDKKLMNVLKPLEKHYPEMCAVLYRTFFLNSFMGYFVTSKFGVRSVPIGMCGKGAFRYFALLDILEELPEHVQDEIFKVFGEQGLWGVIEEDIDNE